MILVDANQIAISHLMVRNKIEQGINIESIRQSIVRVLARIDKKFRGDFGKMVLCYDDKNYWRREIFPFYKKNRKQERETSKYDWDEVFSVLNIIRDEVKANLPYQVIQVEGAEADDVIASICTYNDRKEIPEPVLILSADKDFIQLKKFSTVSQYNPLQKHFVKDVDPIEYIAEHIIKGDRSDGIPNFLSSDDTFVTNKRQRPISKKNLEKWIYSSPSVFCNTQEKLDNYERNKTLIDLDCMPVTLRQEIVDKFKVLNSNDKTKLSIDYFVKNELTSLMNNLEDF